MQAEMQTRRNLCAHPRFQACLAQAAAALGAAGAAGGGAPPGQLHVYALLGCPYSDEAARIAGRIPGSTVTAVKPAEKEAVRRRLAAASREYRDSGHRTFPVVFQGGGLVGGCDDLRRLLGE